MSATVSLQQLTDQLEALEQAAAAEIQAASSAAQLEELRVSFFAQELRTPQPVSAKRLDKAWAQMTA